MTDRRRKLLASDRRSLFSFEQRSLQAALLPRAAPSALLSCVRSNQLGAKLAERNGTVLKSDGSISPGAIYTRIKGALELPRKRRRDELDARDNTPGGLKSGFDLYLVTIPKIIEPAGCDVDKDESLCVTQLDQWPASSHDGTLGLPTSRA